MFPLSSRRESERRNHSLARHADILAAVETRLSLLNMTFMKYVDSNLCCFIPGKVSVAATGKQLCSISSFQDRREKFPFKKLIFSFCSKSTFIFLFYVFSLCSMEPCVSLIKWNESMLWCLPWHAIICSWVWRYMQDGKQDESKAIKARFSQIQVLNMALVLLNIAI